MEEVSIAALRFKGNMTLKGDAGELRGILRFSSVVAGSGLLFFRKTKSLSIECMWNFFFSQTDKYMV